LKLDQPKTLISIFYKNKQQGKVQIGQDLTIYPPFQWNKENISIQYPVSLLRPPKIKLEKTHWTIPRILNTINQTCFKIHKNTLPPPYDILLASLVFGNTTNPLPQEINDAYMRTGVIHLLVVSGAQVSLLLTTFSKLCKIFHLTRIQSFIFSSFFNLFFVLLTGAGPSISRAGIMAEFALLSQLSGRPQSFYHTLSLSALVLLILHPFYVFHIGFQLSFLATFALFYLAPILEEKIKPYFGKFASPLSISLAPLILSTPLIIFYFNRCSLVALIANLFTMANVEILVYSGFLTTILGLFGLYPLALFLNKGNYLLLLILNKIITFMSKFQFSQINVIRPPLLLLIGYYIFLLICTELLRKNFSFNKKHLLYIMACLIIIFALNSFFPAFSTSKLPLNITVLDVGQGDSILIDTPKHKKYLIDGGAYLKGNRSTTDFLSKKGINRLNGIILTHAHADHLDGLLPLIENIKIDWIIISGFKSNYANYKKFLYMIKKKKIPLHLTQAGQTIYLDADLPLTILHPSFPYIMDVHSPENDNSVVGRLTYKKFSILFTGDLAEAGEKRILSLNPTLNSTLIKLGHHGSRWSSTPDFLDVIRPQAAIISCGKNNRFNHPHQELLKRLPPHISLYRTDLQGNILISSDGQKYIIHSER
ncbi:MAG: DNA internalization-related competence protein ComEC/Rec2, partial [Candidatus Margulisbacteria bacterium]|nr:DNA internalization-related competence protein ComEC/Rec2 [Candidatus Margulisiibacteriota bacterium]